MTTSYYDVETDQNLSTEEYQQLHPTNLDKIAIINKSGSNFTSEKALQGVCGPGWWDDYGKTIAKKVTSTALVISYFTPIAPITITATVGTAAVGAISLTGNKEDREIGGHLLEVAADAGIGALGAHLIPGAGEGSKGVAKVVTTCCKHLP